jgi:hypothetical protein
MLLLYCRGGFETRPCGVNIMKFPNNSRELMHVFKNASTPDMSELDGEYLVDMLTVWPSFKRFSHRKIIYREDNRVKGYNVLFNKIWGHFAVKEGICREVDSLKAAEINYNRPENMFHVRRIRDHIRCVEKGTLYIGRFNYEFFGRPRFLGYFSLEKIM